MYSKSAYVRNHDGLEIDYLSIQIQEIEKKITPRVKKIINIIWKKLIRWKLYLLVQK